MAYQEFRPSKFRVLPPVVKNLLIINGLFYLASIAFRSSFGIDLVRILGLHYIGSEFFRPYQIVTHMFMHGYYDEYSGRIIFLHIFSNMFSLWMFGNALENLWGGKRFFIYYIVTGLGAALLHSAVFGYEVHQMKTQIDNYTMNANIQNFEILVKEYQYLIDNNLLEKVNTVYSSWQLQPHNPLLTNESVSVAQQLLSNKMNIPTVGASGAVFGVLLAFGMTFPNTLLFLIFLPIPIKAKYFVILYGAFELYAGFQNNPSDNVAHFAHLGGMLFGFIVIKYWNRHNRKHFY